MSAVAIAVSTAAVGIYGANRASSAAKSSAAAQTQAANTLAGQADRSADLAYQLGQQRLAFERQQYNEMMPIAREVSAAQIAAQNEQLRQARDYYDYNVATFRPLEQGLVRDAQDFSTEAYREQLAAQAAEDAANAFRTTQDATARGFSRMGVSPNSGAAMAMGNQNALALASARAGAMTGTRREAEQIGWARRLDAAGLGRNLPGASTAAYGAATQAGSAGLTSAMAPGAQYSSGMGAAANTILAGTGQQLGALGGLYSGASNLAAGAQNNYMGLLGGLVGMGGTVAAAKFGQG